MCGLTACAQCCCCDPLWLWMAQLSWCDRVGDYSSQRDLRSPFLLSMLFQGPQDSNLCSHNSHSAAWFWLTVVPHTRLQNVSATGLHHSAGEVCSSFCSDLQVRLNLFLFLKHRVVRSKLRVTDGSSTLQQNAASFSSWPKQLSIICYVSLQMQG